MSILAALIAGSVSSATGAEKPESLSEVGNWEVARTRDAMTDKISCTAYHKKNRMVQVSRTALYIDYRRRGGVSGYQVRFDDAPASRLRLATDKERLMSVIILPPSEVERALKSKRLRVEGLTVVNTGISEDIDLAGIEAAHGVLAGPKCK
jgi:Pyruvate/2-oxoacid:ferredoxin oxidoreductase gamma subunit